jgi:RimJ/RimL family protein N-acetyltransferase
MNISLRPWKIEDAENLVKYANNPNVASFLNNSFPNPYTVENAKSFIEMASQEVPTRVFAINLNGEAIGSIGLHLQSDIMIKNVELGYFVGEAHWGNGYATEAIKQIVPYEFEHFDIVRIYARPFGNNRGSQKALEKSGFVLESRIEKTIFKNNEFQDELIYAVRK